jgi:iron complex transport system substrate-binding protein
MPFDDRKYEPRKPRRKPLEVRRIYVCEDGNVRLETRHFRRTFAPEEFVALLRTIVMTGKIKNLLGLLPLFASFLFFANCSTQTASTPTAEAGERIVSIGGAVTEIVYALGADKNLVGADTSSIYPQAATRLPQVGYQRQLSAEGVLSLKPTLVLMTAEAGPPVAVEQIEAAGVKIIKVGGENTPDGAREKIREIAAALNEKERGERLIEKLYADLNAAEQCAETLDAKPKVLFIYSRAGGAPQVSGANTSADAMINLAGGRNAVDGFENFKPLTPESLVEAAPDFILLPSRGLDSIGGVEAVLKIPGMSETPAGKSGRIITIDDLVLLGFGPRMGAGVKELCEKLQG